VSHHAPVLPPAEDLFLTGSSGAYPGDIDTGGFPFDPIQVELRALGFTPPLPPSVSASRMAALRDLWTAAGLEAVETREITVQRSFPDFDDFWSTSMGAMGGTRPIVTAMAAGDVEQLKARVRTRLSAEATGRVTYQARANAIKGRVPKAA
jgi:hypothetical protein